VVACDEDGLPPADGAAVVSDGFEEIEEGHGSLSCVPLSYSIGLSSVGARCDTMGGGTGHPGR
jgi:hypothetical protein